MSPLTREEKLATFQALSKRPGIKTGRELEIDFHLGFLERTSSPSPYYPPINEPVRLLFDHPFADSRSWVVVRRLKEPQYFLVSASDQVLGLHESQFAYIQ